MTPSNCFMNGPTVRKSKQLIVVLYHLPGGLSIHRKILECRLLDAAIFVDLCLFAASEKDRGLESSRAHGGALAVGSLEPDAPVLADRSLGQSEDAHRGPFDIVVSAELDLFSLLCRASVRLNLEVARDNEAELIALPVIVGARE